LKSKAAFAAPNTVVTGSSSMNGDISYAISSIDFS